MKNKWWLNPAWLTALAAVGASFLQIVYVPNFWDDEKRLLSLYITPVVILCFAVLSIVLISIQKRGTLQGEDEVFLLPGMGAMLTGAMIGFQSVLQITDYLKDGTLPTPYTRETNQLDTIFFKIMVGAGVVAGIGLLIIGVMWIIGKSTRKTGILWLTVFPVIWAFCRLARFTISYVSTIRVPITYSAACVLMFNAMFFFMLGRQMVHYTKAGSWLFALFATVTAVANISTVAAQTVIPYMRKDYFASTIFVVDMNDAIIGLFALIVVASIFTKKSLEWAEKLAEEKKIIIPADEEMKTPFKMGDEVEIVNKMIEQDTDGSVLPQRPFNEAFTDEEIQQQKEQVKQETSL